MLNIAYLTLENGLISQKQSSFNEASRWFRKVTLCEPANCEALYNLGRIHENGLGQDRDLKGAYMYYKKAAQMNHPGAITKCGDFLYSGRLPGSVADKEQAFRCYQKASEMNCPAALNNLGLMLEQQNNL